MHELGKVLFQNVKMFCRFLGELLVFVATENGGANECTVFVQLPETTAGAR